MARVEAPADEPDPAADTEGHGAAASTRATSTCPGSAPESSTETYVAVRLTIDSPRWEGVPVAIRAGKTMPLTATEVVIRFRPAELVADDSVEVNLLLVPVSGHRARSG